jgi:hypothetical protein
MTALATSDTFVRGQSTSAPEEKGIRGRGFHPEWPMMVIEADFSSRQVYKVSLMVP